jgi:hypothetical protein
MLKKAYANSMVTDGWVPLDAADMGLIESVYKKTIREGEERLMLAVLESAVEDFQKYVLARKPRGKKLFQEAEEWFLERNSDELFSFENICDTLQLHPDYMRQGLMVWKQAKFKTLSVEGDRQDRTKLHSTRVGPLRASATTVQLPRNDS